MPFWDGEAARTWGLRSAGPTCTIPYRPLAARSLTRGGSCRRGDLNPHALAGTSPSS